MTSSAKSSRDYGLPLACLLALASVSCGVLETWSDDESATHPLAFNHKVHADADLQCGECHSEGDDLDHMPSLETCGDCHDVTDEDEDPKVVQLLTGIKQRPAEAPWFRYNTNEEILFKHAKHAAVGCGTCHGDVAALEATNPSVVPTMDLCVECHETTNTPSGSPPREQDCAGCHSEIRKDTPPASHELDWETEHGRQARAMEIDGTMDGECARCHQRDTCTECHKQEQPRSHTNFFRLRGHGLEAANDRESCATCHQTDMCVRCHEETTPISHRGAWGAPTNGHCVNCHLPVAGEDQCAVCHKTTPSHTTYAPPRPSGHRFFTLDCRSCHGVTAALNHPDNGSECLACHQ